MKLNLVKKFNKTRIKSKSDKTYVANGIKDCTFCGRDHKVRQCPAYGQKCAKCKGKNHFAKQCKQNLDGKKKSKVKSEKVRTVEFNDSSSDGEYHEISAFTESVGNLSKSHENKQFVIMKVNGKDVNFLVNSGATCNVMGVQELRRVSAGENLIVKKNKTEVLLKMYNKYTIKSFGTKKIACTREGNVFILKFHVVNENVSSVIGFEDAQKLSFIKVLVNDNPDAKSVHDVSGD